MIELKEGAYVVQFFFADTPGCNIFGMLTRLEGGKSYQVKYRFRHFIDDKVFGSKDTRSWLECTVEGEKEGRDVVAKLVVAMRQAYAMTYPGTQPEDLDVDVVDVESDDVDVVMAKLGAMGWAHTKTEPQDAPS
jgi:hypothetical protein